MNLINLFRDNQCHKLVPLSSFYCHESKDDGKGGVFQLECMNVPLKIIKLYISATLLPIAPPYTPRTCSYITYSFCL